MFEKRVLDIAFNLETASSFRDKRRYGVSCGSTAIFAKTARDSKTVPSLSNDSTRGTNGIDTKIATAASRRSSCHSKSSSVRVADVNRVLNRISNQRLRFNVRKTIQLAAEYHRYDAALQTLARLAARNSAVTATSRGRISSTTVTPEEFADCPEAEIGATAPTSSGTTVTAVERTCREIRCRGRKAWEAEVRARRARRVAIASNTATKLLSTAETKPRRRGSGSGSSGGNSSGDDCIDRYGAVLLSLFVVDDGVQRYAQFCDSMRESFSKDWRVDIVPPNTVHAPSDRCMAIGMRNEQELQRVLDSCRRAKRFPVHLLPPSIRADFIDLLRRADGNSNARRGRSTSLNRA